MPDKSSAGESLARLTAAGWSVRVERYKDQGAWVVYATSGGGALSALGRTLAEAVARALARAEALRTAGPGPESSAGGVL